MTCSAGADSVWVFWNQGDATFASHSEHAVGTTPYGLAALDFDRDGAMDLAPLAGG